MIKKTNFTELSDKEKLLILKWRNSPKVSNYMHTKNISIEDHLSFIKNLQQEKDKNYFLVQQDNKDIGVIYLTNNFLGIYANPEKKRVGDILLSEIIKFAFNEKKLSSLKAEVFKENSTAIKLYKRLGFVTIKDNETMLIMEVNNKEYLAYFEIDGHKYKLTLESIT